MTPLLAPALWSLIMLGVFASSMVHATNGYFAHGYSLSQKALGGAGTAVAEDALIVTINPAGMVWVDDAFELNFSLFTPIRDFSATERGENASNGIMSISPGSKRSHNEYFPIPAMSYKRAIGDWASWGLSLYGNGGMNSEYVGHSAIFGEGMVGFETECSVLPLR
jgi:long-chain fatty acid transport protein